MVEQVRLFKRQLICGELLSVAVILGLCLKVDNAFIACLSFFGLFIAYIFINGATDSVFALLQHLLEEKEKEDPDATTDKILCAPVSFDGKQADGD